MKRTEKFGLAYFEYNDVTDPVNEIQRWVTLDAQLYAVFSIMGNGVISGWNILAGDGLSIVITEGSGHVDFIAVESRSSVVISNLNPNIRNHIYAQILSDSYWSKQVSFSAYASNNDLIDGLYIGYVDTDLTEVIDINIDDRKYLGYVELIRSVISTHRHIGGTGNPEPVNLSSEVQGVLSQDNLPDLDASILKSGQIDVNRLPLIDHISQLINQGTLTHAQIDAYIESLNLVPSSMMGEVSTINLLQLILAMKHVYPEIDEYMVNEISYIPGISPDSFVDFDNTTASVDIRPSSAGGTHVISGVPPPSNKIYTRTWSRSNEFLSGDNYNIYANGDVVSLGVTNNKYVLEDFDSTDGWVVTTMDMSSIPAFISEDTHSYVTPPASGLLDVKDNDAELSLVFNKIFPAQDWSGYNYIVFYLKTDSVKHGDIYFYINDVFNGVQDSYTKVLNRETPTIDINTMKNGWQMVVVDITAYSRSNINTMGFFVSTNDGWDGAAGFDLNMDNFYLSSGNIYNQDGYFRVIYGGDFKYDFWRVRWDSIVNPDSGAILKSRTRVGDSLTDLSNAIWSSYSYDSGYEISLPSEKMYQYIEIEMFFESSLLQKDSVFLRRLYLDYYTSDIESIFEFSDQNDWSGGTSFNIDRFSSPGSILIDGVNEIGDIYYGVDGEVIEKNENLETLYSISGSMFPRSTNQIVSDEMAGFGAITAVVKGDSGYYWATDIDNDRVVEFRKDGQIRRALYGSFLASPNDPYGQEDGGPGSNIVEVSQSVPANTSVNTSSIPLKILHSIYNPTSGILYIIFDDNLENIYADGREFLSSDFYLKIGTHVFSLNESDFRLLGVDKDKYIIWNGVSENIAPFINQFKFNSHIMEIILSDVDRIFMSNMVNPNPPSIVMLSPLINEIVKSSVTLKFVTYNFDITSSSSGNHICYSIDGGDYHDLYGTEIDISGLSESLHTIDAKLVNADGSINTNIESILSSSFIVNYGEDYSEPYVFVVSPKQNQIYSSPTVVIEFETPNFSILPEGQHLRYIVDGGVSVDYYSSDPFILSNLDRGSHNVDLYLVDRNGNTLPFDNASCSCKFIVGLNSNALVKLYASPDAIKSIDNKSLEASVVWVDVGEITMCNIYSPIDVQILSDNVISDESGITLLISKLRSPSWTGSLGGENNMLEILRRSSAQQIENAAEEGQIETTTTTTLPEYAINFIGVPDNRLIYGSNYMDGHSVVRMSMDGDLLFSNNAAQFAPSKFDAKLILGGSEQIGNEELLVADANRKRAIIVYTDPETQTPSIVWQYDSDKYVSDFHMVIQDPVIVYIDDDAIRENTVYIRQGTSVIWQNRSSQPVYVYSGTTSYEQFYADPDLDLYGDQFKSTIIYPGDRYIFKFVTVGEYDWFVYPGILTGTINVTRNRISNTDQYIILENDRLPSPFTSRVIKVDAWGNVLWSFGEGYLMNPKDARPLLNGGVIISV